MARSAGGWVLIPSKIRLGRLIIILDLAIATERVHAAIAFADGRAIRTGESMGKTNTQKFKEGFQKNRRGMENKNE
ncbi:MAG: hypothetical protein J7647_09510 [Cyanobacteria bacterium SBLK]|nr:hypothetical protein [Cyanobacteria bacterium SBLK]